MKDKNRKYSSIIFNVLNIIQIFLLLFFLYSALQIHKEIQTIQYLTEDISYNVRQINYLMK